MLIALAIAALAFTAWRMIRKSRAAVGTGIHEIGETPGADTPFPIDGGRGN